MRSSVQNIYVVKHIDEFGNCFHEGEIEGFSERQKYIREWIDGSTYTTQHYGDVTAVIKCTGEEVWFFQKMNN